MIQQTVANNAIRMLRHSQSVYSKPGIDLDSNHSVPTNPAHKRLQ